MASVLEVTKSWKSVEAVEAAEQTVKYYGPPSIYSPTIHNKTRGKMVWKGASLVKTIFSKIMIRDIVPDMEKYTIPNEENRKFVKIVSVTIQFDLGASENRDKVMFDIEAPISYNVQQKKITAFGKSLLDCIGILVVVTMSSLKNGCKPEDVIQKNLLGECITYLNDPKFSKIMNLITMSQQLQVNIQSQPGNPIPKAM